MWQVWLILAGVFIIIEMATVGFFIFWLAIASLVTMLVSFFVDNLVIQLAVFVITSTILFLTTKPLVDKYFNKKTIPTNTYKLINKKGIVKIDINNTAGTGQIKVDGEVWSAKSNNDLNIPAGTEVEIVNIDGVKLVVTPTHSTSNIQ